MNQISSWKVLQNQQLKRQSNMKKIIIEETVSASKLIRFKKWLRGIPETESDNKEIRIGNLIDALITKPKDINMFTRKYLGQPFSNAEYDLISAMYKSYMSFIKTMRVDLILETAENQKSFTENKVFVEQNLEIHVPLKCIYDKFSFEACMGFDIKTTMATTQKAFINGLKFMDQDQSRYLYTQTSGLKSDIIIGISKIKPYKVFWVDTFAEGFMESGRNKLLINLLDFYLYA